jgi:hypothetical protein
VEEALRAVAREPFVAVTGSLYFIGEVLERLGGIDPSGLINPSTAGDDQRRLNEWAPATPR